MTWANRTTFLLSLGFLALVSVGPAWASSYTYMTIDFPGSMGTFAFGINDAGQIVGEYVDATGAHGFLYASGGFSTVDFPGVKFTQAFGINASGQIVGDYTDGSFNNHGFIHDALGFSTVDFPRGTFNQANGINTTGQIVGQYVDGSGTLH